jgi:hypothetical protein
MVMNEEGIHATRRNNAVIPAKHPARSEGRAEPGRTRMFPRIPVIFAVDVVGFHPVDLGEPLEWQDDEALRERELLGPLRPLAGSRSRARRQELCVAEGKSAPSVAATKEGWAILERSRRRPLPRHRDRSERRHALALDRVARRL